MKTASERKKTLKKLTRFVLLIICGGILGVNVYLVNANKLMGDQLPMPFGYGVAVVLSGSMEPEFSEGDLIIVQEADSVAINDIVVFQDGAVLVVHRIIAMDDENLTTKGDANAVADDPISRSAVKGRVLFWIPGAGNVVNFLKTPIGTFCVIVAAIALVEIPRRNEKKKDDEERQRIIDEINRLKQQ